MKKYILVLVSLFFWGSTITTGNISEQSDTLVEKNILKDSTQHFDSNFALLKMDSMKSVKKQETAKDKDTKKEKGFDSSLLGSFLGSLISGLAAVLVFLGTIFYNCRIKNKKNKVSLSVIINLLSESLSYLDNFMDDIKKIGEDHALIQKGEKIKTPLPYREPYAIKRLKDFDLEYFSELMSIKNIQQYPELIINLDHIYLFCNELNKQFEKSELEIEEIYKKNENKKNVVEKDENKEIISIYERLINESEDNIKELENAKKVFNNILNQLKI